MPSKAQRPAPAQAVAAREKSHRPALNGAEMAVPPASTTTGLHVTGSPPTPAPTAANEAAALSPEGAFSAAAATKAAAAKLSRPNLLSSSRVVVPAMA